MGPSLAPLFGYRTCVPDLIAFLVWEYLLLVIKFIWKSILENFCFFRLRYLVILGLHLGRSLGSFYVVLEDTKSRKPHYSCGCRKYSLLVNLAILDCFWTTVWSVLIEFEHWKSGPTFEQNVQNMDSFGILFGAQIGTTSKIWWAIRELHVGVPPPQWGGTGRVMWPQLQVKVHVQVLGEFR